MLTPSGQECKPNLYHLICGPPSTGKCQAVKETGISPVNSIAQQDEDESPVIQKITSSGLTKILSTTHKGYIICTEIFDTLFKLLKGDNDTGTGDSAIFCELFSGEQVSLSYGTQAKRDIPQKMPFCIFGCIQVFPLAKIMSLLDQGHGLLDRFLMLVSLCLRPIPAESEEARTRLSGSTVLSFTDIFVKINELIAAPQVFKFSKDA